MAFIKPVSSLSIKRSVNMYTITLFLSFGALLYWLAVDRYQVFVASHEESAANTTRVAAYEIRKTLKEKQQIIDIFVERSKELIDELLKNPEDEDIYQQLWQRLEKYQSDIIAFNIIDMQGRPAIDDFNGDIGVACLEDIDHYIKTGKQRIRMHLNHNVYHYDVISKYSSKNISKLVFVSFDISEIVDALDSTQPVNHNLMLINKQAGKLKEANSHGVGGSFTDRWDFSLSDAETLAVLSENRVKGTEWHVIDMPDETLFKSYRKRITNEYLIAFYIFAIIAMFMRHILLKQDEKRTDAEKHMLENNVQIKSLNKELELLSITDSLTGLYNRRYFDEAIQREWSRGLRSNNLLSCILIDVDYFKNYNDLYGHQSGDKCLKDIAMVMKDTFRRAGDVVARYGGEEFIIIMSETDKEGTIAVITQFWRELEKLKILHESSLVDKCVTVSAGLVSQVPSGDESIEDFIRKADKALYKAKTTGRNQWLMYEDTINS